MSDNTYNGWSNKQTWNISMMYGETFQCIADEQAEHFVTVDDMADSFEAIIDELEFQPLKDNSLAQYAVGIYMDAVDWVEIAEHYFNEPAEEEIPEYIKTLAAELAE